MQAPKRPRSSANTEESRDALCWRHNKPLVYYCCTDEQVVCAECTTATHSGHNIGLVKEERRIKEAELRCIQEKTQEILQKQEKEERDMEKALELIKKEANITKDYCECVLAGVIDSLQRHYQTVRERIEAQEEAAASEVQTSLLTLRRRMKEMKERNAELNCLAQTDDANFLQRWPSLARLCNEDHLHAFQGVTGDPLHSFGITKRAVKQLGSKLNEFCRKEFASISQTGLPEVNTVSDLNLEPNTRAEFLQYACSLSLDHRTAHRDLEISTGDKVVRLSPQTVNTSVYRDSEQFLHRKQVLCREGLHAERCYYEVEIRGDKVEIALAYKGIDRKSRMTPSAFGANAKSWSLDRSTHYSVSHRGDSIQLTTPPTQKKIGVYLKFREGTVSFYEVSDTMKFLYKMEAQFTEPLYPGFWLSEGCCIRICDL
ncbi:tripartite motif-containing protein 16-like [Halichoeres trimaculatus]|uniref:tripartite motif-containing protein 16-like n=1 Tax=Halichoeres trimaculatus TaxID=147232 RepID=UPI003D9E9062